MVSGVWGKKVGMTQVFDGDRVVPVTAIDVNNWLVLGFKNTERDGYEAVVVGSVRPRYTEKEFSLDWLKKLKTYFAYVREIKLTKSVEGVEIGKPFDVKSALTLGDYVDVFGITKGHGFAGGVRRHGFTGARASHGSTMGKRTGSLGGARSRGKVFKGKRMPGHMGVSKRVMANLQLVRLVEEPTPLILVKGSVPGKAGSFVFVRKVSQ